MSNNLKQNTSRSNVQHTTCKALAELGKAIKTLFRCRYLHGETLRRVALVKSEFDELTRIIRSGEDLLSAGLLSSAVVRKPYELKPNYPDLNGLDHLDLLLNEQGIHHLHLCRTSMGVRALRFRSAVILSTSRFSSPLIELGR